MRFIFFILALLLFSCQPKASLMKEKSLGENLKQLGIEISEFNDLTVDNIFSSKNENGASFRLKSQIQKNQISFDIDTNISVEKFQEYQKFIHEQFLVNFYPKGIRYAGAITRRKMQEAKVFPTEYHLVLGSGQVATFYRAYVNERFGWGVTLASGIEGIRYWGLIHDSRKNLMINFQVTYPKDQDNQEQFLRFVKTLKIH